MVRPGDRIAERYEVIEQLAAGGMGVLWRARHLELDVEVAIKLISGEASAVSLKRFKREAQAAARLRSPHVVRVHDYGVFEGQPFLAMELLHGEDLAARLARAGKLLPGECLRILSEVARGLDEAHAAGIVHRDLKPANVFIERVSDREVIKLLDFGVAKDARQATDGSTTTGVGAVGSPAYMSPEQVWGEAVGPAADLWALSVLCFELLTGKSPFVDETLAKVFERIIRAPLPRASELAPELPPTIEAFFERGLARAPQQRFGSARELVAALELAVQGNAPAATAATAVRGKNRLGIGLALVLLSALATVVMLARWAAAPSPAPAAPLASQPRVVDARAPEHVPSTVASQPGAEERPAPVTSSKVVKRPPRASSAAPSAVSAPRTDPLFGIPVPN